jgi:hypothetical protein
MRYITLFFLLLAQIAFCQQNRFAFARIAPEMLKNANAVVREHRMEVSVLSPSEITLKEYRAVTLLNDNSHYDILNLHYNSLLDLGKIKGKIYDSEGRFVRDIEKKEIDDASAISGFSIYEDSRRRYVDVDYAPFPFTVEFEYDMTFKGVLNYPGWNVMDFHTSVEQSSFLLDLPQNLKVYHKALNFSPLVSEADQKDRHIMLWRVTAIPAVVKEPYCPTAWELLPRLLVSPDVFKLENYTGSMRSWKEFGQFMQRLSSGRDELTPAMKAKVQELTASGSEQQKIEALYRYLQDNYRYVSVQLGIGGWQTYDAKYVEEKKYGDCKALSNFMKAMLQEAGIPASTALVYAGENHFEAPEDFATNAFNHVILYVPSQDTWLECTSNLSPVNYLGTFTAGRNVLLINEEGGRLIKTPDLKPSDSKESNVTEVRLKAEGEATITVNAVLTGEKQEWHRQAVQAYGTADLRKEFSGRNAVSGFNLDSLRITPVRETPQTQVFFTGHAPRYASKSGKRIFVPLNALNAFKFVPPAEKSRTHPICDPDAMMEEDKITVWLPAGYRVESAPTKPFLLETPYGSYRLSVVVEEAKVTVERTLVANAVRLPATEYDAWRNFYKEVSKADGAQVVLVGE